MTGQLQSTLQSVLDPLQSRLTNLVAARQADVETMRGRTTPWQNFLGDSGMSGVEDDEKIREKIARVEGVAGFSEVDGIGNIERWAEEVVRTTFLTPLR